VATDLFIPSIDQLRAAKKVEESILKMLEFSREEALSTQEKDKIELIFKSYRRLSNKIREAAGRTEELKAQFERLEIFDRKAASLAVSPERPLKQTQLSESELRQKIQDKFGARKAPPEIQAEEPPALTEPPEEAPESFTRVLGPADRRGAIHQGPEIELLQGLLNKLGFRLKMTGQFDQDTFSQLRHFQMKAKLPITGMVDQKTAAILNQRLQKIRENEARKQNQAPTQINLFQYLSEEVSQKPETQENSQTERPLVYGPADQPQTISQGAEVEKIQAALIAEGFSVTGQGEYDAKTFAAVRSFQAQNRIQVTGLVDDKTYKILEERLARNQTQNDCRLQLWECLSHYAEKHQFEDSPLKQQIRELLFQELFEKIKQAKAENFSAPPDFQAPPRIYLKSFLGTKGQQGIVSEGEEVIRLQETLLDLGYDLKINQTFDLQTFTALKKYQEEQGLSVSGYLDPSTRDQINPLLEARYDQEELLLELQKTLFQTLLALGLKSTVPIQEQIRDFCEQILTLCKLPPEASQKIQKIGLPKSLEHDLGPAGRAKISQGLEVFLLQQILKAQGFEVAMSAEYDPETLSAVRSYQTRQKLAMTGIVDTRTRQSLNQKRLELSTEEA